MNEKIASAEALLTANAELRQALDVAMQENEQRMLTEQEIRADYAMLRSVARRAFSENEQSMLDLWDLVESVEHPGVALIIRYNRAKTVVEAVRRALDACPFCGVGRCRSEAHEWLSTALAAHDAALKAGAK